MKFGNILRLKRKERELTQQDLANQLHVTRQTLSRWENNLSYPNLDTLVALSETLQISLDSLLKGDENLMVKEISRDVRDKKKYKRYLLMLISFLGLLLLWLGILGYGRSQQNEMIDRFNPFLKDQVGYGILPKNSPNKVDAYISDDPFGKGSWLKFKTGKYNLNNRWAVVEHKGSYVKNVRLVKKSQIPLQMRQQAGGIYLPYDKSEPRTGKPVSWWPFD